MLKYKTEYFKDCNEALKYLKQINYRIDGLQDDMIIFYANLNKDRELGHAEAIEVANPRKLNLC